MNGQLVNFDKLVDGGVNYPQFAMVTLLRLTACSTPLGFLTSCSYSQAKIQYPFLRASSSTRL